MTPNLYEEYLQHQITQAEAKKVVDEFIEGITLLTFEDLHLQSVGEVGEFTAMMQDRINKAFSDPTPSRMGVGDRLFDKIEDAPNGPWKASVRAAAAEIAATKERLKYDYKKGCPVAIPPKVEDQGQDTNRPKIKLSDIRDFANG